MHKSPFSSGALAPDPMAPVLSYVFVRPDGEAGVLLQPAKLSWLSIDPTILLLFGTHSKTPKSSSSPIPVSVMEKSRDRANASISL